MMPSPTRIPLLCPVLAALLLCLAAAPAPANDLDAVSDGEHLWLVLEDPDPPDKEQAGLLIYHLAAGDQRGEMAELKPIAGGLMPRGLAAGDGRLLMVMDDRRVQVVQPARSDLLRRWVFERRALPDLPEGCALVAVTLGAHGPWALVRVESRDMLNQLDQATDDAIGTQHDDPTLLNRALGLPDEFRLTPEPGAPEDAPAQGDETQESPPGDEPPVEEESSADPADSDEETDPADAPDREEDDAPQAPAYRLIHLRANQWISSPLPEAFAPPRRAVLVMREGDARPTLVVEPDAAAASGSQLVRYLPATEPAPTAPDDNRAEDPADYADETDSDDGTTPPDQQDPPPGWIVSRTTLYAGSLGRWSAVLIDRQVVVAAERDRSDQSVSARAYLLRGTEAIPIGSMRLPTNGRALWAVLPWRGGLGLVARPGPELVPPTDGSEPVTPLGGLVAMSLDGELMRDNEEDNGIVVLIKRRASPLEGNADFLIQIGAFLTAMVMMLLFYKRAPRESQIQLPQRVVLATFGRRLIAGLIDLAPGFWLAGMLYDITLNETVLYWPGNGVAKVLPAMRPGFVVIAVTLLHTSLFEFVTARSIGKWATGLYVADLNGKPAAPMPALGRALSRVFELFAPLMLMLPVISPGRQRLGDILAKTIVVMKLPEETEPQDSIDEDKQ